MVRRWNNEESELQVLQRLQKARTSARLGWGVFGGILIAGFIIPRTVFLSDEVVAMMETNDLLSAIGILYFIEVFTLIFLYLVLEANPGYVLSSTPPRYSHRCPECHVTVEEFDHHCGVLGVCIGKGNLKYFIVFLLMAALLSAVATVLGGAFVYCVSATNHVVLAFRNLALPQFCQFFFMVFCKQFHCLLGTVAFLAALQSTFACFGMFLYYLYKAVSGKYAVERRRFDSDNFSFEVFHEFFRPKFRLPSVDERTLV